jgi:hypothetical protein
MKNKSHNKCQAAVIGHGMLGVYIRVLSCMEKMLNMADLSRKCLIKLCWGWHWSTTHVTKLTRLAGHQWLTPVILAAQEAEIRRVAV